MKETPQKANLSQSLFGSAPSAEMEEQKRQRREMQRKRRRTLLLIAVPLILILAGGILAGKFYSAHASAHGHSADDGHGHGQEEAAMPQSISFGYAEARMKLELVIPDQSMMEGGLFNILYDAVAAKPGDIRVTFTVKPPENREAYKPADYRLSAGDQTEFTYTKEDGTVVTAPISIETKDAEVADAVKRLFTATYGEVKVPLEIKLNRPPVGGDDDVREASPLDSLKLPKNIDSGRN